MKYWISVFVLLCAAQAQATTINEAELDRIFGQDSFGQTPIDIRILPTQSLVRSDLLDITLDTSGNPFSNPQNLLETGNIHDLFALGGSEPVVNLFWVESIRAFGQFASGIAEGSATETVLR
ncbi:hypothetical protein [uncultured Roseobacter sp.]|uniref:hypothetical protein n=1 Tax=uncultured Roseobacter sp. TaxID=114847 RepID=UPI00261A3355|nr:hypothetical protein [uncultured Roseobacter sp.]